MTVTINEKTYSNIKTFTERTKIARMDKDFKDHVELVFEDGSKIVIEEPYKITVRKSQDTLR